MQTKKIKDQIGFIENYSYQLKFLYKKIRSFKTSQSKLFINVSSSSIFHKIIKKFSLHNKYLMQEVNLINVYHKQITNFCIRLKNAHLYNG